MTGTKGKSTTAALAAHLARAAGRTVSSRATSGCRRWICSTTQPADVTVVELSSYHTADLETGPEVALVTSLFREHTDWHGSEDAYRADKLRLLGLPGVRVAVVNGATSGYARSWRAGAHPDARDGRELRRAATAGMSWQEGIALRRQLGRAASIAELPLRGEHNALNLCGALTALEALGIEPELPAALDGFQPLAHRLEPIAKRDGVLWVDDSISTTPESTLAALASFPGCELILIGGGQDRGQDYAQLGRALAELGATVIGVPTTGPRLIAAVRDAGAPAGRALGAADMAEAVVLARAAARTLPGAAVLLSPAAPSYDNYRDFEQRGERFRELVVAVGD